MIKKKQFNTLVQQIEYQALDEDKNQLIYNHTQETIMRCLDGVKERFDYLGIYLHHQKREIFDLILSTLKANNMQKLIQSMKSWTHVDNLHVTLYHFGDELDQKTRMHLESFKENENTFVTTKGILMAEETSVSVLVEL